MIRYPKLSAIVCALMLALVWFMGQGGAAWAAGGATFTVVNTNDAGVGSLRQAILNANSNGNPDETDVIQFNIVAGQGVRTIEPLSALPGITEPVTIDGLTQPGASCQSWPPMLLVELDGSSAGVGADGLRITAGGSTVRGLVVNRFDGYGIELAGSGGNLIRCNLIGTDATGTLARGNGAGGVLVGNIADNTIGGVEVGAGNVIAANGGDGVEIAGSAASDNRILGNRIGTDVTGTMDLGNGDEGVEVDDADRTAIGGMEPGAGNQISGNMGHGVYIVGTDATLNEVRGNRIGTDAAGTVPLGNDGAGVVIEAFGNRIGGLNAGNTVAFNGGVGVQVVGGNANPIQGNAIFSNGGLGLDLGTDGVTPNDPGDVDGGPNARQNFPVLNGLYPEGNLIIVQGMLTSTASTLFHIEFFASATCDPSGHGEGQRFLGATDLPTTAAGELFFDIPLPGTLAPGELVTATATDPAGNTSEFGPCIGQTTTAVTLSTLATAPAPGWGAVRVLLALAGLLAALGLVRRLP